MGRHGGDLNAYYKVKEANLQRLYTLYNSHYMTFRKKKIKGTKDPWLQGGGKELIGRAQRTFKAMKIPCMIP